MSDADADTPTTFGARLRAARHQTGLSQSRLAQRAGLSPSHLGNLERGRRQPRLPTLLALADALGVPPSQLLPLLFLLMYSILRE
jgi:transcriptional regulator with XRE-family HTH domain